MHLARPTALALLLGAAAACSGSGTSGADAARDQRGADAAREVGADAPVDALRPDVYLPFSMQITVNKIPPEMNGSLPFTAAGGASTPFRLTLPPHGFTVDVSWKGSAVSASELQVTADVDLGSGASALAAGSNLASRFTRSVGRASWRVPAEAAARLGALTVAATLGERGKPSETQTITVDIAGKTFLRDPFRLEDTWLLVFSQDNYTITTSVDAQGTWLVHSEAKSNGVADFVEDLRIAGFGTTKMLPSAAKAQNYGVIGTNEILRVWLERLVLEGVRSAYLLAADGQLTADSPLLRIVKEGDPSAPQAATYTPQTLSGGETARGFSMISIGGGDPSRKLLGLSQTVDLNNRRTEANIGPTYGVFPTSALSTTAKLMATEPKVKQLLQFMLGEFVPELGLGGKRVGENPLDAEILAAGFDPDKASVAARNRYRKLTFLAGLLGRLLGALTAHEMGHSLGLVAAGPPPYGLFGGEKDAAFTGSARTTKGHIDTPGFNIMEAGPGSAPGAQIDFAQYLGAPRFNALNRAYLRGRLLLLQRP